MHAVTTASQARAHRRGWDCLGLATPSFPRPNRPNRSPPQPTQPQVRRNRLDGLRGWVQRGNVLIVTASGGDNTVGPHVVPAS